MQHALLRRHVLNPRTAQVDPNDPLMEKDLSLLYRLSAKKASPGADVSCNRRVPLEHPIEGQSIA